MTRRSSVGDATGHVPGVLAAAAKAYSDRSADLRGVVARLTRSHQLHAERSTEELEKRTDKQLRTAQVRSANHVSAANLRVRDAVASLGCGDLTAPSATAPGVLSVAEYVLLGAATPSDPAPGNTAVEIPVVAPALGANLLLTGPWTPRLAEVPRRVALQVLLGSGPGQVNVRTVDPNVRNPLAAFVALTDAGEALLPRAATRDSDITALLDDLVNDVRNITGMLEGSEVTLQQFRARTAQPMGVYQLVVLTDFPRAFDERSVQTLLDLLREGPRCGISFVIHHDPSAGSDGRAPARLQEVAAFCNQLDVRGSTASASWLPGYRIQLADPLPADRVSELVSTCAGWARSAAAPRIDFAETQPELPFMGDSSADRLVATIGREGHRPVEIVLGDEREQRHNILVSGAVGQGKSNLLMVFIHSLAMRYSPAELEMHLLDFKDGVTLYPLAGHDGSTSWLPHAKTLGLNSDRAYGAAVLSSLVGEFETRAATMRAFGDNIAKFRAADPAHVLPRILVVIDEFQVLFEADDEISRQALADLERIARKGRAYGIHLVLASQTLSGITSMMAKQDGIFAQFPLRLALKNSAAESRAVLDQNNAEASRLRYRGELLINTEFGSVEGNRRATVAFADEQVLAELRQRMVRALGPDARRPRAFDGARAADLADFVDVLGGLRREQQRPGQRPRKLLLGWATDIDEPHAMIELRPDPGRHLAIVGAGAAPRRTGGTAAGTEDQGIGALQATTVGLALQHPAGDAEFVVLDHLVSDVAEAAGMTRYTELLMQLGGVVTTLRGGEATAYLAGMEELIGQRHDAADGRALYVVAFGLDRAARFDQSEDFGPTPQDGLHALLAQGPPANAHLLAWWSSARGMAAQLGFQHQGSMDGLLALRISSSEAQDLFGPFVHWAPEGPRGLMHDRTSSQPTTITPFIPLSARTARVLATREWDS